MPADKFTYFVTDKEMGNFERLDIPSDPEEAEWVLRANTEIKVKPFTADPKSTDPNDFVISGKAKCSSSIHGHKVFAVMFEDGRVFDASLGDFRPEHPDAIKDMYKILLNRSNGNTSEHNSITTRSGN